MRGRRLVLPAVMLLLASGCGSSSFTAKGTLTLDDATAATSGCLGIDQPGYDDIVPGAQVVIRNSDGKTVGIGQLDVPKDSDGGDDSTCVYPFTVDEVSGGGDIFSVEVSHRGQVNFKRADATALELTLGSG